MSETMNVGDVTNAAPVVAGDVKTDGQAALKASERLARQASTSAAAEQATADGIDPNHPARALDVAIVDAAKGIVTGTRKKIAICGFATSSRHMVPVNDPEWEIWGLNQLYRHIKRADRWFDIHHNWDKDLVPGTDHRAWAAACGMPFYMMEPVPDVPTAVRYPIERMCAEWTDYYTSTIAFMVALAIDEISARVDARLDAGERPAEGERMSAFVRRLHTEYSLGIFGVDLVVGEEWDWQKACAEFWIGAAAMGRGITVVLPPTTALCKQLYRYGYESEPSGLIRLSELKSHGERLLKEKSDLLGKLHMVEGALQADDYWSQLLTLRQRGADVHPS